MKSLSEKIDFIFSKVIPKKFIVMVIATILVFMDRIDGFQWFVIAGAYLGVNVIQHYVQNQYNGGKK